MPYATNKKLGEAYNNYCKLVPSSEDWICFMDCDIMLFSDFGLQVEEVIQKHTFDLFTCYATRIGTKSQQYQNTISSETNLLKLKKKYRDCKKQWGQVTPITEPISGHFLVFKKSLWEQFHFPTISKRGPLLGIDEQWSKMLLENGKTIARMDGLCAIHYYRLDTSPYDTSHLNGPIYL